MSSYDQPPGMGGYYGASHLHQQHPSLPHPHHQQPPPPQHQQQQHPHAYQQHQQPPYQQHPPPPTHQQPQLPPMPQYQSQMPHQIPSHMPPPDRPGNSMPPQAQAQMIAEPQRSTEPVSRQDSEGRVYKLDVVQQPQRARMCGFGDKDRRPITPPPCVRIIVTDPTTGKEIDVNLIDHGMFVLNVDLWSEDGQREVNLVRHTNSAPSISSTTPCSYTGIADNPYHPILPSNTSHREPQYAPAAGMGYPSHQSQPGYSPAYGGPAPGYAVPQQYGAPGGYPPSPAYPGYNGLAPADYPRQNYVAGGFSSRGSGAGNTPSGMFTRNLIGSLAASAFRLQDPSERIGVWFILQDLSIRTEGSFRLRFSFVNVGPNVGPTGAPLNGGKPGKAPILASCFSAPFTVYSAKKFPGVCDSTPLSKCFAAQGIKIPIRKEGQDSKRKDEDDDDY
ncbi:velvet factor-domain-containing protein [Plectosphaerella plurivora]|uniref:Velvet factor-domain-containing protein n=1 Tax=Plectosphaerella plurivora TaxID=936078 RepID=A0A9P9A6T1_9PEZI|nr:velvet factor-domain-containing protein [Plectosphaerella plurivora]